MKKILCIILATVMLLCSLPLSVFAADISNAIENSTLPVARVESLYFYENGNAKEFRALPDENGTFYFDIYLDKAPADGSEVLVYYRTVDDGAVAIWGDYESVGVYKETFVTLNKSNAYTARVTVNSKILDYAGVNGGDDAEKAGRLISRRFLFELTRIEGNAVLHQDDPNNEHDRDESKMFCYLRAGIYLHQNKTGDWYDDPFVVMNDSYYIETPYIYHVGSVSGDINFQFPEHFKDYLDTGNFDIGIAIIGQCQEEYYQNDGPVTFDLYYTYQGKKQKAMSLIVEGEFDDSTFFGWEHAYDYVYPVKTEILGYGKGHFDEIHLSYTNKFNANRGIPKKDYHFNIDDFIDDNFYGFIIYDNDGKVAYKVTKENSRDVSKLVDALENAKVYDKYIVQPQRNIWYRNPAMDTMDGTGLYYMRMPTNFVNAESFSWTVTSDGDKGEARRLKDVKIVARLIEKEELKIAKDENGEQMITTNIDSLREGDNLKMMVRFNQMASIEEIRENAKIHAKINGIYDITLYSNQLKHYSSTYYEYNSWDTFVFEAELPDELKGVAIKSIRDITLDLSGTVGRYFESFVTQTRLIGVQSIDDIYGLDRDFRTPVATVNEKSNDNWMKAKSLDIYVNTLENNNSRFNDFVTVYYQWSNSKELPETYSSQLTFYTADDGEVLKTIMGKGNGETYLHMKTISRYGKSSISDAVTTVYDPTNETATYTPFGPYKFDDSPPELSVDDITVTGSLKSQTISIPLPDDNGGSGLRDMSLYYITKSGEERLLKKFTAEDFTGTPKTLTYTISHIDVGIGVDRDGNVILDRGEVEFCWVLSDKLGNISKTKTAYFSLMFDTHDYLSTEIGNAGPKDIEGNENYAKFVINTQTVDDMTFIYNHRANKNKNVNVHSETAKNVYYGFAFEISSSAFEGNDRGTYSANITYNGTEITDYTAERISGACVIWFHNEIVSGRYDIQLIRTEGESTRVSQIYTVYATDAQNDLSDTQEKVEFGTLLSNSVYQLSTRYYYKDSQGAICAEDYNGSSKPATFSSYEKAKEYVRYKEYADIYLIQLTDAIASALLSGTTGYLIANGEEVVPRAGQYWIRYKSESWTPTSGESAWVYYYYDTTDELITDNFSVILTNAIESVSNRIVSMGKSVILTDSSLILDNTAGDIHMLDSYGMPYLLDAQMHIRDEISSHTKCGNRWSDSVAFAADKNLYKSTIFVGEEGSLDYKEYPIIGNFAVPEGSRFQYLTYEEYSRNAPWKDLAIQGGEAFINVFAGSGVYYIREMSNEGVSVYSIYVDKEAPRVTFSNTDDEGNHKDIPVDGSEVLDIRTKDLYIGNIAANEYDRLSYVAVYRINDLSLVAIYTARDLDSTKAKLPDGNYYIVVADRSGNHYIVTAKVSNSDFECQIKESKDRFIRLTCNRRSDQIVRYEIYLNGALVTSTYSPDQTFDKTGRYTITIQDIYGNVFSEEYVFNRNYPTVTWKYLGSDGKYHVYDSNDSATNGFIMAPVSDNQYKISTSVKTRFTFSEGYEFEFVGVAPEYTKTIGAETTVTINEGQSFTLKVYYKSYKECYTIYSGVVDVTPPSINVSADVDIIKNGEYDLIEDWAADGSVGDIVDLKELYCVLAEIGNRPILNGGTVSSDIIKINAHDANDLSLVEVYLDGKLIKTQDIKSGFSQIVVSAWGSYRVVAKDALGNVSEFKFTNGIPSGLDYFVDGVNKELDLHSHLNFKIINGKRVYTKIDYGNKDFRLDISKNSNVFISIGVSGGNEKIFGFRITDGNIYPLMYKVISGKDNINEVELSVGNAIIDTAAEDFKADKEYLIAQNGSHAIYASISANNVITIKVYAPNDSTKFVSVNARVEIIGGNTLFVASEISKKASNVSFKEFGMQSGSDIRANNGFTIDESLFAEDRIASVKLYYSNLNDLDVGSLSEKDNIYTSGKQYNDDGFYILVVKNLYGNEKIYRIAISKTFGVTSSVTFGDGHKIYYSKDYNSKLYSNSEIALDILDEDVKYTVTLNGEPYTGFGTKTENGILYLVFSIDGTYEVKLSDSYGNVITKQLEINKSSYTVADELLTGYNEKALKRAEGYTNQKLSINKTVYDRDGIYYLAIKYGDSVSIIFDAFAETPVSTDAKDLVDIIGANGDGVYTVICRNRYGAVVSKDIHYRATPTLKLERTTRSEATPMVYDLSSALSVGFWSNNTLIFSTDAKTYVFTINGSVTECPRTLAFDNEGDYGSSEYEITYIDEYGFEYRFKAYLLRRDITVDIPPSITSVEIDGLLTTKNDILINFGENIYATYTLNNGEAISYHSGDVLKKDGTYRFIVSDYAGNATTVTIKKDTIVEFIFTESDTGTVIQNGGVVNSSKISIRILNKDTVSIEKVLCNGVVQTDFTGTKFTGDGKWELILCDKLGNKAYFCFYIITRAKNGFAYTTPYEYRITELWYDNGDGIKVSYMNFVTHGDFTSSFDFTENGKYTVVMTSDVTGVTSTFDLTINTIAPAVSLVGCNPGETTINDVTLAGCKIGDRIKIYMITDEGEKLVEEIEVASLATKMPTITEGGKYRIVVESEAGVTTELTFVRKHVMNTAGSIFIMVVIGLAIIGLFTGLIYRNKSKTDD